MQGPPGVTPPHQGFTPPPAGSYAQEVGRPPRQSGYAVAALICGITPVVSGCFPLGFIAIYLGAKARRLAREHPEAYEGEGMALAGMILGGLFGGGWLLFWLFYLLLFVGVFAGALASSP